MDWMALIGPAGAGVVTGVLLLWQQAKQRTHEKEEREKEREHQRELIAEERESARDDEGQARRGQERQNLEAANVEFLAASNEIYYKLTAHQKNVEEHWGTGTRVFLPGEPNLTRLTEAHSKLTIIGISTIPSANSVVDLLVDLHNVAAAESRDSPTALKRLEEYPPLRHEISVRAGMDLGRFD